MTFQTRLTVEEFDKWVLLPENIERNFEYIGGEIVEVVSYNDCSVLAGLIFYALMDHIKANRIPMRATTSDGGYQVLGERYIPDVGLIYKHKYVSATYTPNAPDLAVEVVSPTDSKHEYNAKIGNYLAANTVVWLVYPEKRKVEVYVPQQSVQILHDTDTLDDGTVLPNFKLSLKELFDDLENNDA